MVIRKGGQGTEASNVREDVPSLIESWKTVSYLLQGS